MLEKCHNGATFSEFYIELNEAKLNLQSFDFMWVFCNLLEMISDTFQMYNCRKRQNDFSIMVKYVTIDIDI